MDINKYFYALKVLLYLCVSTGYLRCDCVLAISSCDKKNKKLVFVLGISIGYANVKAIAIDINSSIPNQK